MAPVAVLDYGMGNLRSVAKAIERVGGEALITSEPGEVLGADALVVPGVGAFGACMANLRQGGLDSAIRDFVARARPVLGVCLGMQVLFEGSEEDEGSGLDYLPGVVRKLPETVKLPHMGWNQVRWTRDHPLVRGIPSGTRFYFVHSYAPDPDAPHTVGVTEHGREFAAAVAHDVIFATQFHPEKSGEAGLEIYRNFVKELS